MVLFLVSARKRVAFLLVGLVLITGLGFFSWLTHHRLKAVAGATTASCTFSDVPSTHEDQLHILSTCIANVMSGYGDGTFRPSGTINNGTFATALSKAMLGGTVLPKTTADIRPHYCDVTDYRTSLFGVLDYLFTKQVLLCSAPKLCRDSLLRPIYWTNPLGRPLQLSACTFSSSALVTREQAATLIARAVAGGDVKVPAPTGTAAFKDIASTRPSYKYIQYLANMNVIDGYPDGTFHPTENITRAHTAKFLSRAYDLVSTAFVANISGKVTTSTGAVLANSYLVFDEGDPLVQADANGSYNLSGIEPGIHEVQIFDQNGIQYEAKSSDGTINAAVHIINLGLGNQQIDFGSLQIK